MKRWGLLILALILIALAATAISYVRGRRAQKKREATYQSALLSYSEVLSPGMTRKEVEDYLRAKGIGLQQMCCVAEHTGAYDDLTKIGRRMLLRFCSEQNIYVAFEFSSAERHSVAQANPSDTLRKAAVFRWLEGCL